MEGFRNQGDKLWDISVHNPNLLKSKNRTLPQHAGLYSTTKRMKKRIPSKAELRKVPPIYEKIFDVFDDIIDFNKCVNI